MFLTVSGFIPFKTNQRMKKRKSRTKILRLPYKAASRITAGNTTIHSTRFFPTDKIIFEATATNKPIESDPTNAAKEVNQYGKAIILNDCNVTGEALIRSLETKTPNRRKL